MSSIVLAPTYWSCAREWWLENLLFTPHASKKASRVQAHVADIPAVGPSQRGSAGGFPQLHNPQRPAAEVAEGGCCERVVCILPCGQDYR